MSDQQMLDGEEADLVDEHEKAVDEISKESAKTGQKEPETSRQETSPGTAVATSPKNSDPMLMEDGLLAPKNSQEELRVANMLIQSGSVPQVFKTAPQVMMAMQFLRRYQIDPILGIRRCTIVNGTLTIWGELPLGLVNRSGRMESFSEVIYDKDYKEINLENKNLQADVWGATCIVKMTGKAPIERSFTKKDAETANLWGKSIWNSYPKRMLQMRARGWALKDAAPEVLSGISILEYDYGTTADSEGRPMLNESSAMEKMKALMRTEPEVKDGQAQE